MESDAEKVMKGPVNRYNKDNEVKDRIRSIAKELFNAEKAIYNLLQRIHEKDGLSPEKKEEICNKSRAAIEKDVTPRYREIDEVIKSTGINNYYKYHDIWRNPTQKLVYLTALTFYLESGKLISHEGSAEILGIKALQIEGFHLDDDDYFIGLLSFGPELSRLAKNRVTYNDYKQPKDIHKFLEALYRIYSSFPSSQKNELLRKKFDTLRYEFHKVEEVLYDVNKLEKKLEDEALVEKVESLRLIIEGLNLHKPEQLS